MNFEIKYKDARGRVGLLDTPHGTIKTPALMPVIHPGKQTIDVKKFGAEIVITNAYIIYKNHDLRIKALENGVHDLINFSGPIVTDSGSFQLYEYGDIDTNNVDIIKFQEEIGSDIGTSLDIPTPPFVTRNKAEKELEITIKRAEEALTVKKNMMLNSVVQGSTFTDLRSKCAEIIGGMDFDVYPIGAVVPLMESYRYSTLLDVIMASVEKLPDSRPRHLMGAGHPMIFAFAVALGCDLFDSAAYILYAEKDRLLMPNGTIKLENIYEMPCSCPICSNYKPNELRSMSKDDRVKLLAQHNLHVSLAEIRLIRQSIAEGVLWELVEERSRSHPYLLEALRNLKGYTSKLEKYDPIYKKSAFFYTGPESLNRPGVHRHLKRVDRLPSFNRILLLPPSRKPYSRNINQNLNKFYSNLDNLELDQISDSRNLTVSVVDVPFVLIPLEIEEVYPLNQNESPSILDEDAKKFVSEKLKNYLDNYEEIILSEDVMKVLDESFQDYIKSLLKFEYNFTPLNIHLDDDYKVKCIADYQFGTGSGEAVFKGDINIVKSKKTGKIRHVYDGEELITSLRASDGALILGKEGARRLHDHLKYPKNRVVINDDAEPFALEGKSIFAKFVIDCDSNIRASEEVLIVNRDDELLAIGKSLLCAPEIMNFKKGQAVKTRKGGF